MGSEDYLDDLNDPRVNAENDASVVAKALQSKKPKHFGDTTVHYRFYVKINPNFELFNPIEYHSSITDKKLFSHIKNFLNDNNRKTYKRKMIKNKTLRH